MIRHRPAAAGATFHATFHEATRQVVIVERLDGEDLWVTTLAPLPAADLLLGAADAVWRAGYRLAAAWSPGPERGTMAAPLTRCAFFHVEADADGGATVTLDADAVDALLDFYDFSGPSDLSVDPGTYGLEQDEADRLSDAMSRLAAGLRTVRKH